MKRTRRRGIVMMIALFSLLVITMLVAATMTLMPTQLFAARHGADTGQAYRAACSGVDYAQARLQEDPRWVGNPLNPLVVSRPDLQIVEQRGNVIGVLIAPDGERSAFRLRFNFQNGGDAPDEGLTDPDAAYRISSRLLSTNNLEGAGASPTYPVDGGWRVPADAIANGQVPRAHVELQVEGLSGPELAAATPANLDALVQSRPAILKRHIVCRLGIHGLVGIDSAVSAADDIQAKVELPGASAMPGVLKVDEADGAPRARVRSLGNVSVAGNYLTSANGKVIINQAEAKEFHVTGMNTASAADESRTQQEGRYLKLGWNDVPKADASNTRLKAGTYVWRAGSGGGPELAYYPQNYSGSLPSGTGAPVHSVSDMVDGSATHGLEIQPGSLNTVISDKVFVQPQGAVTDLAILIDPDLQNSLKQRPKLTLISGDLGGSDALLTSSGNFHLEGSSEGYGSIVSEGDLTLQGSSLIEVDPEASVALYARGDVQIDAIPDVVGEALITSAGGGGMGPPPGMGMGMPGGLNAMGMSMSMAMNPPEPPSTLDFAVEPTDVSFAGLIYTQGSFRAHVPKGNFYLRGLLTAFGGDPDLNQPPGSLAGSGKVQIDARNARFIYDPSYLQQLVDPGHPVRLDRVSWNLL